MSNTNGQPVQLTDLPDNILLLIFGYASINDEVRDYVKGTNKNRSRRRYLIAGEGARTLCFLSCCSRRFNHLASADQLWQPLTLAKFPGRHWATTDQKYIELVRVQREHQLKILKSAAEISQEAAQDEKKDKDDNLPAVSDIQLDDSKSSSKVEKEGNTDIDGTNGVPKRTKFYSRFEQRAHRRRFASLDPELKYTPLLWTNSQWTWKRTYFGDCRFVQSENIKTPNRIDRMLHRNNIEDAREECSRCWRPVVSCICSALSPQQYCNCRVRIMILQHPRCQVSIGTIRILKLSFKYCQIIIGKDFNVGRSLELDQTLDDPNCTPYLLYPSFSAIDIHQLAQEISDEHSGQSNSRFHCRGCIHQAQEPLSDSSSSSEDKPYPYRLIIALDGSWSHAKLMYRFNPRLQQLAQIKFPSPPQSIYHQLKPEPKPTYTSTAEAVGQAIALLGWPKTNDANNTVEDQGKHVEHADLLFEDLIRPLELIIELQRTITKDIRAQENDQEQELEQVHEQE